MRILVQEKSIHVWNRKENSVTLDYGREDIARVGFQCVDHAVEEALKIRGGNESVMVEGSGVESKMVARKIEDKIVEEVAWVRM